jgi:hypothetical protein
MLSYFGMRKLRQYRSSLSHPWSHYAKGNLPTQPTKYMKHHMHGVPFKTFASYTFELVSFNSRWQFRIGSAAAVAAGVTLVVTETTPSSSHKGNHVVVWVEPSVQAAPRRGLGILTSGRTNRFLPLFHRKKCPFCKNDIHHALFPTFEHHI